LFNNLLLEDAWFGETESNLVGGELVIAVGNGIKSSFHRFSVEWVKVNSLVSVAVHANSH
jgi:hypothetical protein